MREPKASPGKTVKESVMSTFDVGTKSTSVFWGDILINIYHFYYGKI
jgi:hypothetical protein